MKLTKRQLAVLIESLLLEEEAPSNQPAFQRNIKRGIANLISVIESETENIDVNIRQGLVTALKGVQQKSDSLINKGDKEAIKELINPIYGQFQGYKRDGNIPAAAAKKFDDQFRVIAKELDKLEAVKVTKQATTKSKGSEDVKAIQQALNDAGYTGKDDKSKLVVDGIFGKRGSNTDYAYQQFIQKNYKNNNKIHFLTGLGKGAEKSMLHTSNIGNNGWRWGDVVDLIDKNGNKEVKGKYEKSYKGMLAFINDVEGAKEKEDPSKAFENREFSKTIATKSKKVKDLSDALTSSSFNTGLDASIVYSSTISGAPTTGTVISFDKIEATLKSKLGETENFSYGGTKYPSGTTSSAFVYNAKTKELILDTMYADYVIKNVSYSSNSQKLVANK